MVCGDLQTLAKGVCTLQSLNLMRLTLSYFEVPATRNGWSKFNFENIVAVFSVGQCHPLPALGGCCDFSLNENERVARGGLDGDMRKYLEFPDLAQNSSFSVPWHGFWSKKP